MDAPRGLAWDVNATVSSPQVYGGQFNLYLSNAVEPNPSIATTFQYSARQVATTQILRVSAAQSTCPGTAALCRFYLAVERVPDAAGITYAPLLLITNSTQSPPPQLLPGVPQEKAPVPTTAFLSSTGLAGTVYTFNVSCSRAHVTLTLITTTASPLRGGSPMLVNRGPLPALSTLYNVLFGVTETTAVSTRFFTLHFDWTQPALRGQSMAGQWLVNVAPTFLTGWTLLINITNGDCSPVPAEQSMVAAFTPYAGTASGSSSSLFSYATANTATTPLFFTVTPAGNASSTTSSLQLLVRNDGLTPTATSSQFSSNASGVVQVPGSACSTVPPVGTRCLYTLAVRSSAATPTPFLITVSTAGQAMAALDARSAASRLTGSVARSAQSSFTALVPAGRAVGAMSVVAEACVGSVSLLLNAANSGSPSLPTNVSAQFRLANVTLPTLLTVPGTTNLSSHLIGAVVGLGPAMNAFELRVMADVSWADGCPTVADPLPKLTAPASVTSGNIKVRLPLATAPRAITSGMVRQPAGSTLQLRYSVFVLDRANTSAGGVQLRSRCGAQRAALVYSGTGLTASSNTVEFKAPKPTARYQLVVLVEAVWRWTAGGRTVDEPATAGYTLYTQLDDVRPGSYTPEPDDDSSTGTVEPPPATSSGSAMNGWMIGGIVVVLLAVVAVLSWLLWRRLQLQKGMAVGAGMQHGLMDGQLAGGQSSLPADTFVQQTSEGQSSAQYAQMAAEGTPTAM